jgi:hypothetical protein
MPTLGVVYSWPSPDREVSATISILEAAFSVSVEFCRQCGIAPIARKGRPFCGRECSADSQRGTPRRSIIDRFWEKVDKHGPIPVHRPGLGPCWLWTGRCNNKGYGRFSRLHQSIYAHRAGYELLRGAIPAGLDLDHLCFVKACVNPSHLDPVTSKVNAQRAHARRTICFHGHPFTHENTYTTARGHRGCRQCLARQMEKHAARRRELRRQGKQNHQQRWRRT